MDRFDSELKAGYAIAKLLLNNVAKRANELGKDVGELGLSAGQIAELAVMKEKGTIGAQAVDPILAALVMVAGASNESVAACAERLGLVQVRDDGQLDVWCDAAIVAQPQAADDVRSGKDAAIGRLVGHVMKLSGGKVDAKSVNERLRSKLGR